MSGPAVAEHLGDALGEGARLAVVMSPPEVGKAGWSLEGGARVDGHVRGLRFDEAAQAGVAFTIAAAQDQWRGGGAVLAHAADPLVGLAAAEAGEEPGGSEGDGQDEGPLAKSGGDGANGVAEGDGLGAAEVEEAVLDAR